MLQAWHEVVNAIATLRLEQVRRARLRAQLDHTRAALSLSRSRYNDGVTDFLSVLDAERSLLQNEQQYTTSTTNVALNWRRDTRRETAHLRLDAGSHHDAARRIQVPDQTLRADQQLLAEHHSKEIRDAIESLPTKQLAAVLMHKYEGLDYAAIAEVLDCSIPALKSLLFRAYETLRRRLAHFAPQSVV